MTDLTTWMSKKKLSEVQLAERVGISQSQVNRIRRGVSGASPTTARKLAAVTGIAWHKFIKSEETQQAS